MILIQNKIFVHSIGGEYNKQLRNQLSLENIFKKKKNHLKISLEFFSQTITSIGLKGKDPKEANSSFLFMFHCGPHIIVHHYFIPYFKFVFIHVQIYSH
jgi:hypothetical protein